MGHGRGGREPPCEGRAGKRGLVDQSRLCGQADRGCREGGSHSAAGASDTSQGCHDRIQPRLLRERHGPHGRGESSPARAIKLDKEIRKLAIYDEDLKPLWDWIAGFE